MSKQEKLLLQARNKNGTYEETFCKKYIKRKRGYIFYAIFRWQSIALFVGLIICCLLHYLFNLTGDDDIMATIISLALIAIFGFAWLYFFFMPHGFGIRKDKKEKKEKAAFCRAKRRNLIETVVKLNKTILQKCCATATLLFFYINCYLSVSFNLCLTN